MAEIEDNIKYVNEHKSWSYKEEKAFPNNNTLVYLHNQSLRKHFYLIIAVN